MKKWKALEQKSKYNFKFGRPYHNPKKSNKKFAYKSVSEFLKSKIFLAGLTAIFMVAILFAGIYYHNNRLLVVYANGEAIGYVTEQEQYAKIIDILKQAGPASCDAMLIEEEILPPVMDTSKLMMESNDVSATASSATMSIAAEPETEAATQYEITTELKVETVWKRPAELQELTVAALLSSVNIEVNAAVISIDGQEVAVLANEHEANEILDIIVKGFTTERGGSEILDYNIKEDVKIELKPVVASSVISRNDALNLISTGYTQRKVHVVQRGDSLWSIGNENGMTVKEVRECNPDLKSGILMLGQKIAVEPIVPYVNIETSERLTTYEYVNFKTVYQEDSYMYTWQSKTLKSGVKGKNEVVYDIVKLNGREVSREKISSTVLSDPVTRIVAKGTKIPEATGTGSFIWPVDGGGTIYCKFGWTGRRYHYGLDIATPTGTNIFAADDGVVTTSSYGALYGYYIIIDHGNGYSTVYAHNSRLIAKVGQKVTKGTVISKSGSTGNSTGPHLHFEIRKDGKRYNPLNYFS